MSQDQPDTPQFSPLVAKRRLSDTFQLESPTFASGLGYTSRFASDDEGRNGLGIQEGGVTPHFAFPMSHTNLSTPVSPTQMHPSQDGYSPGLTIHRPQFLRVNSKAREEWESRDIIRESGKTTTVLEGKGDDFWEIRSQM